MKRLYFILFLPFLLGVFSYLALSMNTAKYPKFVQYDPKEAEIHYRTTCSVCHQINGQGIPSVIPPLVQSSWLKGDPRIAVRIALQGLQGPITVRGKRYDHKMPSQSKKLTPEKLASILTYARSSWGNDAGEVSPELVREEEEKFRERKRAWTVVELLEVNKN